MEIERLNYVEKLNHAEELSREDVQGLIDYVREHLVEERTPKTDAEASLIEGALAWRRIHGPATRMTSEAMKEVAVWAEAVIRERNLAAQTDAPPSTSTPST